MSEMTNLEGLSVHTGLYQFINEEVLPGLEIDRQQFWNGFQRIVDEFHPRNLELLATRETLQRKIDEWHIARRGQLHDAAAYKAFLTDIGYIEPDVDEFQIATRNVDDELALIAGPQLVVPVNNARYALNAANARWGSLYDALYGTDAIAFDGGAEPGQTYNPVRGKKVIAWGRAFLDDAIPLATGSHADVTTYSVSDGAFSATLNSGERTGLRDPEKFVAFNGAPQEPDSLLFVNNRLHIDVRIDKDTPVGAGDAAGVSDIVLEAAVSVIMDCEDSVTAVDGDDKVAVYRNWLGLMKGDLEEQVEKGGKTFIRRLNAAPCYARVDGSKLELPAQALMFVRCVGLLMTNPSLSGPQGDIAECIVDIYVNTAIALHDKGKNSRTGSIYFVIPKLHGPEEVKFICDLLSATEDALGLQQDTIKIGIMDEERRMSINLKGAIHAARSRVCFINTGFLDRTGDEIHTSMQAGVMIRKGDMKQSKWIAAYEDRNVDIGLACGFSGRAQVGKGMWAMPDRMADMLAQKQVHPEAGANTAWVPSPTAATLHATHYHRVCVEDVQETLRDRNEASLDDILAIPLADGANWSGEEIDNELENNAQGILGYMVRWVEQGVGCSKVPDIHDIGLMEDRATLRISSQHITNWLVHGVVNRDQVLDTLTRMAGVVDKQNAGDPDYRDMTPDVNSSIAFKAACELVFTGTDQPSGYTEPVLHAKRLEFKKTAASNA